jgi:hypothetical protein
MTEDIIEAKCDFCDHINQLSGSELRIAIDSATSGAKIGMNCMECGHINLIQVDKLPTTGKLSTTEWVAKSVTALNNSWLPCIVFTGAEAKLPLGERIEPGDLLMPRLWTYKNANLDKAPDGSVWWSWEDYAKNWGFDPFLKLVRMRGPAWEKRMFGDQQPHHRTRVFVIPKK